MIFAIGLHSLKTELMLKEYVNKLIFILNFVFIESKRFVRLCAQINWNNRISKRRTPATPESFSCKMVQIVCDPEGISLNLKAGKDNSKIHHGFSQRRCSINAVFYSDKFYTMLFQKCVKGAKIHHIGAYTVNLVDDHTINQAGRNILPKLVHAGTIHVRAYKAIIFIVLDGISIAEVLLYMGFADIELHLSAIRSIFKI